MKPRYILFTTSLNSNVTKGPFILSYLDLFSFVPEKKLFLDIFLLLLFFFEFHNLV